MKHIAYLLLLIACGLSLNSQAAKELPSPQDTVILSVSGQINMRNQAEAAVFDHNMLESLPQHEITTATPWTDAPVTFKGPLLRDVLSLVQAKGDNVQAKAINDYAVSIPVKDAQDYDVILAIRLNGKPMKVRDKGPLWVIYPWSAHEQLRNETYYNRSIWQLKALHVE